MGLKREAVAFAFMVSLMALRGACHGAVYKVGDSAGWTNETGVDYIKWASSKLFFVGDIIVFEYDKVKDNVVLLSPVPFLFCVASNPLATYSTGKDYITLYKPGYFLFASGSHGHCRAGQKVQIMVYPPIPFGPIFGGPILGPSTSQPWAPAPAQVGDSPSPAHYSASSPIIN